MTEENFTTNTAGIPAASDEHSLSVGPDGLLLLQDPYLIEKMAQFNEDEATHRRSCRPHHSMPFNALAHQHS